MNEILACRTCLATDIKLHNIYRNNLNSPLQDTLQLKITLEDGYPHYLCGYCVALLKKYEQFKKRCHLSQNLLQDVADKSLLTPDYLRHLDMGHLMMTLSVQNIDETTHLVYYDADVKHEKVLTEGIINNDSCKEEIFLFEDQAICENAVEQKIFISIDGINTNDLQSDEDMSRDVDTDELKYNDDDTVEPDDTGLKVKFDIKQTPLDSVKLKNDTDLESNRTNSKESKSRIRKSSARRKISTDDDSIEVKSKIKKAKKEDKVKTRGYFGDKKYLAKLLVENKVELKKLTKQEQIDEVMSRKTSVNYVSSLFRCDQCFKGFWKESTYKNHMVKHDPISGAFACDICRIRYSTKLKMNKHRKLVHSKRYRCTLCDYVSINWGQAKYHHNYHQGVLFKCEKCSKEFKVPTSYYTHMRIHHPSEHLCNICGDTFLSEKGLMFHNLKVHKGEELRNFCKDCGLYFKSDEALDRHMSTASAHNRDGLDYCNYCNHCGESFQTDAELRTHLQEHKRTHKVEEISCDKCNKIFRNPVLYTYHYQKYHQSESIVAAPSRTEDRRKPGTLVVPVDKALVCEVCGKKYSNVTYFEHHKRIHTGEKPYPCKHCPKRFRTTTLIKIHERTHTGERPYKCPSCPKAFGSRSSYNAHSRVHSGIKPYQCTHCGKAFSQWSSHKLHVTTVHFKLPAPYKKKKKAKQLID